MSEATTTDDAVAPTVKPGMERVFTRSPLLGTNTHSLCPGCGEPNAVRVEGYTDDQPIHTLQFDSNWELSAARAASVVHVMIASGVAASRLAVVGYGDQQPVADNATLAGRNANRRVLLVILSAPQSVDAVPDDGVVADRASDAPQAQGGAKHAGVD